MTEGCGLCGGELDDHGVRVTLTFAAGLRNGNQTITVPWKLDGWPLCWACFTAEGCKVLRAALADEYIEPVMPPAAAACHAVCAGGRTAGRRGLRAVFSVRQGSRGLPDAAKCPVCLGPCQVERAA
jgi:hypothetical protein